MVWFSQLGDTSSFFSFICNFLLYVLNWRKEVKLTSVITPLIIVSPITILFLNIFQHKKNTYSIFFYFKLSINIKIFMPRLKFIETFKFFEFMIFVLLIHSLEKFFFFCSCLFFFFCSIFNKSSNLFIASFINFLISRSIYVYIIPGKFTINILKKYLKSD